MVESILVQLLVELLAHLLQFVQLYWIDYHCSSVCQVLEKLYFLVNCKTFQ